MFSDNESCIKGCIEQNVDNYQQMKSVVPAYINKRDCNIQEFIYHILAGQWLRKTCPGVIFANSNLPKKKKDIKSVGMKRYIRISRRFSRHF